MQGVRGSSPRSSTIPRDQPTTHPSPAGGGCVVSEGTVTDTAERPNPDRALRPVRHRAALAGDAGRSSACTRRTCATTSKPKYYLLTMYPYPSGDLHIGHWYIVTPSDALARFRRMHGYNVFFPIGFDAFGLPAENAAIRSGGHPFTWTMANIEKMRRQFRTMGATFAWDAEVVTADPEFYRWNQWLFLRFLEQGLAYRMKSPVDWCPNDGTLAREQVEGVERRCWRCGALVEKRDLDQWYLRTTAYADELLDFTGLDWPDPIRTMQTNWIGRSEGAEIDFTVAPDEHQPGGDRPARLHDPTGHAVRGDVHGPGARAPARGDDHPPGPSSRGRRVRRAGPPPDRDRAPVDRPRQDRRRHRRRCDQPDQRRTDPDLHRRLRPVRLRHGRDHGRARPRRARLRVRDAVRPADPARRGGARHRSR